MVLSPSPNVGHFIPKLVNPCPTLANPDTAMHPHPLAALLHLPVHTRRDIHTQCLSFTRTHNPAATAPAFRTQEPAPYRAVASEPAGRLPQANAQPPPLQGPENNLPPNFCQVMETIGLKIRKAGGTALIIDYGTRYGTCDKNTGVGGRGSTARTLVLYRAR